MPSCRPDPAAADHRALARRSEVLKAQHRLRRAADFRVSTRRGVRVGRSLIVVHYLPADPANEDRPPAVGLTVGRTIGGAVVRNTVRRRLRHLMAERVDRLPSGSRVVVRALPPSAEAGSAELGVELDAALDRALAKGGSRR